MRRSGRGLRCPHTQRLSNIYHTTNINLSLNPFLVNLNTKTKTSERFLSSHRPLPVLQELVHPTTAIEAHDTAREVVCSVDHALPPLAIEEPSHRPPFRQFRFRIVRRHLWRLPPASRLHIDDRRPRKKR